MLDPDHTTVGRQRISRRARQALLARATRRADTPNERWKTGGRCAWAEWLAVEGKGPASVGPPSPRPTHPPTHPAQPQPQPQRAPTLQRFSVDDIKRHPWFLRCGEGGEAAAPSCTQPHLAQAHRHGAARRSRWPWHRALAVAPRSVATLKASPPTSSRNLLPGTLAYNDRVLAIPRVPPQSEEEVQRVIDQVGRAGQGGWSQWQGGLHRVWQCAGRLGGGCRQASAQPFRQVSVLCWLTYSTRKQRQPACQLAARSCALGLVQVLAGSQSSHISGSGFDTLQSDDEDAMM